MLCHSGNKSILGLQHTHEFNSSIHMDKLPGLIGHLQLNETRIVTVFALRRRTTWSKSPGAGWSTRNAIDFINQILRRWGFSKLSRQERKRQRRNGSITETSAYSLTNSVVVNVYQHVKPITKKTETAELKRSGGEVSILTYYGLIY
jgi:hypothetical protein